jgi:sortase A
VARPLALALALAGLCLLMQASWIPIKAEMAQWLIGRAWQAGRASKPWPWADTRPLARLHIPSLGLKQYVLSGGQGNALAFGPTQAPDRNGATVISGHRDTHFRDLEKLQPGQLVSLTDLDGVERQFRVSHSLVVDSRYVTPRFQPGELLLITCYPFDAITAGGPLRYLVYAKPVTPWPSIHHQLRI